MQIADGLPSARVLIRLLMWPVNEGGRSGAFFLGYRPHFVVAGYAEQLGVCAVEGTFPVAPGTVTDVLFALVYYPGINYAVLAPGCKFAVHEGNCVVGTGEVLSIHVPAAT